MRTSKAVGAEVAVRHTQYGLYRYELGRVMRLARGRFYVAARQRDGTYATEEKGFLLFRRELLAPERADEPRDPHNGSANSVRVVREEEWGFQLRMDAGQGVLVFKHRGRTYTLSKRRRHQWWTDIVLAWNGGEALIGREEAPLTRAEAKRLAREWLDLHRGERETRQP